MLKKTITYTDPFTDEMTSGEYYFNISKAEATEMAMIEGEGLEEHLKAIAASSDAAEILKEFKKIVAMAYGERTPDGKFIKSPELSQQFLSSEAYSELFMEFITNTDFASEFMKGILPKDLESVIAKIEANNAKGSAPSDPNDKRPAWIREDREPTSSEMQNMTKAQLVEVMQRKNKQ